MTVTPEMIAAFADGELGTEDRLRVEAAIAADPELATQLERHRKIKAVLTAHYSPIAAAPVPDHLSRLITRSASPEERSGKVTNLAEARARRGLAGIARRWVPVAGSAIAASLLLAIWQPWQGSERAGYAPAELAAMLETRLVANQPADAHPRVLLSFRARDGRFCRAWREAMAGGIACRDRTGWKIEQQLPLQPAGAGEYRKAGSEADLLLEAQDMAVGDALDAEQEQQALKAEWIG